MKKALISIATIIILIFGISLIWLATKKGTIEVSQSIEVRSNTQKAFNIVGNFHTWQEWSPWLAIEPNAKTSIEGRGNEIGNKLNWKGSLIGSGSIRNISFSDNKVIKQGINFIEPFKSNAIISFLFEPTSEGVNITWTMKGKMPFFFRFMTKDMEKYITSDYQRGLLMLKDLIEQNEVASRVVVKGIEKFDGMAYVGKAAKCSMDDIKPVMKQTIYDVSNWLVASSTFPEESFSIYNNFGDSDSCDFVSGYRLINTHKSFPYLGAIIDSVPKCNILKITFYGDYKHLGNGWSAGYSYMQQNNLKANKNIHPFEVYLNDPSFFPNPSDWVTDICIPLKN